MIFEFAEVKCLLEVLKILNRGKSKYSLMFKSTKVSHTTLQLALKEAEVKNLIIKHNIGHQNVDYEITEKGKKLLSNLLKLQAILKE
jgi:DNA-binding HxlR family transcriptional regulator